MNNTGLNITELGEALRNQSVLAKAGAKFKTGLKLNEGLPVYTGSTIFWAGETDDAENGKGTFKNVTLSPKRLTSEILISLQANIQNSDIISHLKDDVARAINEKIESTILGSHSITANVPNGLFSGTPSLEISGVVSADNLFKMEQKLADNKAFGATTAYVLSPKGSIATRKALAGTNDRFVFDGATLSNQNVFITGNMTDDVATESGIVLGNWSELFIGIFDDLDIIIDDKTRIHEGVLRLIINFYCDIKVRRPEAFILGTIKNN